MLAFVGFCWLFKTFSHGNPSNLKAYSKNTKKTFNVLCLAQQQPLDFSRKRGHDEERAGVAFDGADGLFGEG